MKQTKKITKVILEIIKSFWNSSITIFWAFIPLLLLQTYKPEIMEISNVLFQVRIFLIRNWGYFWTAFFISSLWDGIKGVSAKEEDNEKTI